MAFAAVATLGSTTEKVSDTSLELTAAATCEVGNLAAVFVTMNNLGTTEAETTQLSLADSAGNTWTKVGEYTLSSGAEADGITVGMWVSVVTTQIDSGVDTITATSTGAVVAKAMAAFEFTLAESAVAVEDVVFQATLAGTDPEALVLSGLASREYLLLHMKGEERGATTTADADYTMMHDAVETSGGAAASNVSLFTSYRIATLTGDTNDTASGTDGDTAQILAAIYEVAGGTPIEVNLVAATETGAAQALVVVKTIFKTLTAATSTDAAQALSVTKTIFKTLTPAAETGAAQVLTFTQGGAHEITLVPAAETGAAQALSVTKTIFKTLTPAVETGAAQALTYSQAGSYSLTPAAETGAAQALTFTKTIFKTLTPAVSTDAAQTLSFVKPIVLTLTPAAETDAAQALSFAQAGTVTIVPALEVDAAQQLSITKTIFMTLGIAVENDVAAGLTFTGGGVQPTTAHFDQPSPAGGVDGGNPGAGHFDQPHPGMVLT